MKLSKAQQEVVNKMQEGYHIRYDSSSKKPYLNGMAFSYATFSSLIYKGVIEKSDFTIYRYPNAVYQLTEKYYSGYLKCRNNEG